MVDIPASAVDERFIRSVKSLIQRLSDGEPAVRTPSRGECRFCDFTSADCSNPSTRSEQSVATTDEF